MKLLVSETEGRFGFQDTPEPQPEPGEVLVRVMASSVNPRDLRMAKARAGYRSGIDFAGVVERAGGRSGPQPGSRVCGVVPGGAWSELIAVAPRALAPVPDVVELTAAAALASVGLTGLYALERGGELIGRRVLVTGAAGAVGRMACQLASLAGAEVTASVRSRARADELGDLGVHVAVGEDPGVATAYGPFDLILESVGGASLSASVRLLAPGGTCVVLGSTSGGLSALDAANIYQNVCKLVGFGLFVDLNIKPASDGLGRLLRLVAADRISPPPFRTYPWTEVNAAIATPGRGKIVLDVT